MKKKPTPQDIKIFNLLRARLSKSDFETLVKFVYFHSDLSSDERNNFLHDEFPELYEKLIKIGGNF